MIYIKTITKILKNKKSIMNLVKESLFIILKVVGIKRINSINTHVKTIYCDLIILFIRCISIILDVLCIRTVFLFKKFVVV